MQHNFIANAPVPSSSGLTLAVIDPSDGQVFDHLQRGNAQDIDDAVRAARQCMNAVWSRLSAAERGRLLMRLSAKVAEHVDDRLRLREILLLFRRLVWRTFFRHEQLVEREAGGAAGDGQGQAHCRSSPQADAALRAGVLSGSIARPARATRRFSLCSRGGYPLLCTAGRFMLAERWRGHAHCASRQAPSGFLPEAMCAECNTRFP